MKKLLKIGALLSLGLLAACQSTNTGRSFVVKDPAQTGLVWWLPDYNFPAVFDEGFERRDRSAFQAQIVHHEGPHFASLQHSYTLGNTYWRPSGGTNDFVHDLHRHMSLDMAESATLKENFMANTPLGNIPTNILQLDEGIECVSFSQYSNRLGPGYKKIFNGAFCTEGTISRTQAAKIMSGLGLDDDIPNLSLRPSKERHDTLFRGNKDYNTIEAKLNWDTLVSGANLVVKAEQNNRRGDIEFQIKEIDTKCFGHWNWISGQVSDGTFKGIWSVYCNNGTEAFGDYTYNAQRQAIFNGFDNAGNAIKAVSQENTV